MVALVLGMMLRGPVALVPTMCVGGLCRGLRRGRGKNKTQLCDRNKRGGALVLLVVFSFGVRCLPRVVLTTTERSTSGETMLLLLVVPVPFYLVHARP